MVMINAEINEVKKNPVCFYFLCTEKLNCSAKEPLHKQQANTLISGKYCIIFFCTMFVMAIKQPVWMLFCCCNVGVDTYSTMHYRKVMTKLNENNATYVIQPMTSMTYFDSSRKNLTYILNGSQ